jgi:hypothetical protein
MNALPRSKVLVTLRVRTAERDRWTRAATMQHLRLGEMLRLAIRNHCAEVERLGLLAREATPSRPSSAA